MTGGDWTGAFPPRPEPRPRAGGLSRPQLQVLMLAGGTAVVLYVCYRIAQPFLPALAWALALAIVADPLFTAIHRLVPRRDLAAALSVVAVTVAVIGPVAFVTQQLVGQSVVLAQAAGRELESGRWVRALERAPHVAPAVRWLETQLDVRDLARQAGGVVQSTAPSLVSSSAWVVVQLLITLLVLFYFLRDREPALDLLRSLVPLRDVELDTVVRRVADTIHATVFGALAVAAVQGSMGGLMFWALGLPAPLLWGAVMAVLATMPALGSFVVWAPTAIVLALDGRWGRAVVLAAWGGIAIALIDNLLYPWLVGARLRLHPLPVFFSILGGIFLFGAAGVILGPVTLAIADALLDIWRRRASADPVDAGASAERAA